MIVIALAAVLAAPVRQLPAGEAVSRELSEVELRDRVDAFLRAVDVTIEPEQWQALGARALPLLQEIARDRSALPTRRAQAASALGIVGGPAAVSTLAELAADEDQPIAVRMAAVRGLCVASASAGTALRSILETALDARVRAVAAEQLIERSAGKACAEVAAHAAAEPVEARPVFARALARCPQR